jgi:hypothetical protein
MKAMSDKDVGPALREMTETGEIKGLEWVSDGWRLQVNISHETLLKLQRDGLLAHGSIRLGWLAARTGTEAKDE